MNVFSPSSERVGVDTPWLELLQQHPIFDADEAALPAASSSSAGSHGGELVSPRRMCVRHTDIIVAVGPHIRITSLLDIKRAGSSASSTSLGTPQKGKSHATQPPLPSFKTLDTPRIDFDIVSIAVNPTNRLLLVHGSHQVVVVILPRLAAVKAGSGRLPSKVISIGPYYHSVHNGPGARIARAMWHPLGKGGTSLLVATRDGNLREYDVGGSVEEPIQAVSLLPARLQHVLQAQLAKAGPSTAKGRSKTPSRSRGSTPALDSIRPSRLPLAPYSDSSAASELELATFCLGCDHHPQTSGLLDAHAPEVAEQPSAAASLAQADWMMFTVFALLRNGDIFALCPFLPSKLTMTAAAVDQFSALVSASGAAQQLDNDVVGVDADLDVIEAQLEQSRTAARFSASLQKQSSRAVEAAQRELSQQRDDTVKRNGKHGERGSTPGLTIADVAALEVDPKTLQVELVNPWQHESDTGGTSRAPHPRAVPQGPFLMTPPPVELSDTRESRASDLMVTRLAVPASSSAALQQRGIAPDVELANELYVIGVVGDDGRVDLCVALDAVGPRWEHGTDSALKRAQVQGPDQRHTPRPGRFALSDSEDEGHDEPTRRRDAELGFSGKSDGLASALDGPLSKLPLPALLVYETVHLGFDVAGRQYAGTVVAPSFVMDPMYRDKLFVYHSEGVHCLSIAPWAWTLLKTIGGHDADASAEDELKYFLADKVQTQVAQLVKTIAVPTSGGAMKQPGYTIAEAAAQEDEVDGAVPIVGFDIVLDAYLGYAALALTADGRCAALELTLGLGTSSMGTSSKTVPVDPMAPSQGVDLLSRALRPSRRAADESDNPLYISLLAPDGPFVPPEPLNGPAGVPAQPRLVLGVAGAGAGSGALAKVSGAALMREAYQGLNSTSSHAARNGAPTTPTTTISPTAPLQTITPTSLRFLTKALQAIRAEVRDVVRAGNASQRRLDLQYRELGRLLDGLGAARRRYEALVGGAGPEASLPPNGGSVAARMRHALERQKTLVDRLDRLLQRLIDGRFGAHASEGERAWFAELRGMAVEVGVDPDVGEEGAAGDGDGDGGGRGAEKDGQRYGLRAELDKLQHQLKLLRPALVEMAERRRATGATATAAQSRRPGQVSSVTPTPTPPRPAPAPATYGRAQLAGLEHALSAESNLVVEAKKKIESLHRDIARSMA